MRSRKRHLQYYMAWLRGPLKEATASLRVVLVDQDNLNAPISYMPHIFR